MQINKLCKTKLFDEHLPYFSATTNYVFFNSNYKEYFTQNRLFTYTFYHTKQFFNDISLDLSQVHDYHSPLPNTRTPHAPKLFQPGHHFSALPPSPTTARNDICGRNHRFCFHNFPRSCIPKLLQVFFPRQNWWCSWLGI